MALEQMNKCREESLNGNAFSTIFLKIYINSRSETLFFLNPTNAWEMLTFGKLPW